MVARWRLAAAQLVTLVASRRAATNKDNTSGTTFGSITSGTTTNVNTTNSTDQSNKSTN